MISTILSNLFVSIILLLWELDYFTVELSMGTWWYRSMKQKHLTISDCIEIELGDGQDSSFKIITTKIN